MRILLAFFVSLVGTLAASAQTIDTVAGGWPIGALFPLSALLAPVEPGSVTVDPAGNIYIPDALHSVVFKQTPMGQLTIVAGTGISGYSGDGGSAANANLQWPAAVAIDGAGNLLIVDPLANVVRKVDTSGNISTLAGTGIAGLTGDGGPAISANLNSPSGVAVDATGNVYIADAGNARIRRVSPDGNITSVAGGGWPSTTPEPALSVPVRCPTAVSADASGRLFVAAGCASVVFRLDVDGTIRVIAGSGAYGTGAMAGPRPRPR
jgi:sugar lactone lactonase YvrE